MSEHALPISERFARKYLDACAVRDRADRDIAVLATGALEALDVDTQPLTATRVTLDPPTLWYTVPDVVPDVAMDDGIAPVVTSEGEAP